ncbi:MAG TPA: ABC transporter ATP-binding protein [Isosphaeraceae bacterium]|nr:ABC transporter ATP-binding protein [Isosphaeraceae bacterium]
MPVLEVENVRKSFGNLVAVDGVSFRVKDGEIVGLLGPNGAGKTTIVSIICGVLGADSGQVLLGHRPILKDDDPAKRTLGLVPQELALYEELTARDNMRLFGSLYGMAGPSLEAAIAETLAVVGLVDRASDRVRTFSGGMKRRLNLASALMHDPQIILLDEPTVGVDPQSRGAIFESLAQLKSRGKSLLYTTHYMEEAERLCDRVIILDHGRIIAEDTPRGISNLLPRSNRLTIELDDPRDGAWIDPLRELPGVREARLGDAGQLILGVDDLTSAAPRVLAWLAEHGHAFHHVATERPDLEEAFLSLTGKSLRDS